MVTQKAANHTLEQVRRSAVDAVRLARGLCIFFCALAGGWLFVPLKWLSPLQSDPQAWQIALVIFGIGAGVWLGLHLSSLESVSSYQLHYDHTRSVLLDGMLLEKLLSEEAYERLPSLGRSPEHSSGPVGMAETWVETHTRAPGPRQDGFDRRIRDFLRSYPLLLDDIGWQRPPRQPLPAWMLFLLGAPLAAYVLLFAVLLPERLGADTEVLLRAAGSYWVSNVFVSLVLVGISIGVAGSGAEPAGIRFALLDVLSGLSTYNPDPAAAARSLGLLDHEGPACARAEAPEDSRPESGDGLGWG